MEKPECSLPKINDCVCHQMIREGSCPGFDQMWCVNTKVVAFLESRYQADFDSKRATLRAAMRDNAPKAFGHYINQNDIELPPKRTVDQTLTNLYKFMSRVRRHKQALLSV